jgi:GT2 family glycosyltransferase
MHSPMIDPLPVAGRSISIEKPQGFPARCSALEWVMACAKPPDGFERADVSVDGVAIASFVRRPPEQITISAWCDTRGLPPGLHEIAVHGQWSDGSEASDTRLMVVGVGQPAEWWNVAAGDPGAVAIIRLSEPGLAEALARAALGGPPLALLDDDCVPGPGALERIAAAFAGPGEVDVVIGDEASMIADKHWIRWRKRAFAPEALPSIDFVGPLLAVGSRAADILCDALPPIAGLYGFALELLDRGLHTIALPQVLALTPVVRMPADDAPARAAVERVAARRGRPVTIGAGPVQGLREVRWPLAVTPEVVAVIPSCTPQLTASCLAGIAERTTFAGLRVVIVDSCDHEGEMRRVVAAAAIPATHVPYPAGEPFNYQAAVNVGARHAGGAHVLFLNDDVTPLTSDWLTRMVELLTLPGVGIVGALLRHADGRIQHAGIQIGDGSGHRYHDAPADARGHRFELLVPDNPEAVTGACMLVRREVLEELRGHDERYVHIYGDVDLCYRATERGWRVAWCAGAELEHLESASYGPTADRGDIDRFLDQWRADRVISRSTRVRI